MQELSGLQNQVNAWDDLRRRAADALEPLQRAVALSPDNAVAHGLLGDALMDLGRPGDAEASYRRALELKPDLVAVHCNLGSLFRELGRLEEAQACYRHALQLMPALAAAHGNLGVVLRDLGRLEEAEASYRRALEIMPAFAEAHCNLGNILREQGRLAEAEASYRRALDADPNLADAHSNLALLFDMRGDATAAFVVAVAHAVASGAPPSAIHTRAVEWAEAQARDGSVVAALRAAADRPPADDVTQHGWVLVALQNAFHQLLHASSFEDGVVRTVMAGGDTDTNAAIAGALLGAAYGRTAVPAAWRDAVLSCRPIEGLRGVRHPRPRASWPVDALELAERLLPSHEGRCD